MRPPRDKITLPEARPAHFLLLQLPPARRNHPVFVYLDRLAPSSGRAMLRALERIAELLGLRVDEIRWWAIPDRYLRAIREGLGRRYSHATSNQALSALRGVVGVAKEMDMIGDERYQAFLAVPLFASSPSQSRSVPSKRQIARLIATARRDGDPKGLRDAALLGVLGGAGLKRSEVAALRLADFHQGTGTLRLAGGTTKLGAEERALLRAWIAYRGRANGPLFLPMRRSGRLERRQMSGQAIAAVVEQRASQARLGRLSPEDLRRTSLASRR